MDETSNPFIRIYYTSRPVLFGMCAGNEIFYVRAHHMFSRILNFLFVIVFLRKECLFDKNNIYIGIV